MLKKTLTYTNFNEEDVTETFFFNLSKAELIELELSHKDGLSESLKRIAASEDGKLIIAEMKNLILKSYGEKSPDGKRFIKNQRLRDEFESSEAYSELFMELVTDADAAVAFVQGIIPKGMADVTEEVASPSTEQTTFDKARMKMVPSSESQTIIEKMTRKDFEELDSDQFLEAADKLRRGTLEITE